MTYAIFTVTTIIIIIVSVLVKINRESYNDNNFYLQPIGFDLISVYDADIVLN